MHPNLTICPGCDQPFTPKERGQKHCSRSCSNHARRRPLAERAWEKVDKSGDCWEWTGQLNVYGYGVIKWDGKSRRASRIIYALTYGPIPDGLFVCHKCDNPRCVRPDHLFLGDHKDNAADMVQKGRALTGDKSPRRRYPERYQPHHSPRPTIRGEGHPVARLTNAAVVEIRRRYASGDHAVTAMAQEFGVQRSAIYAVLRGKTWKHI